MKIILLHISAWANSHPEINFLESPLMALEVNMLRRDPVRVRQSGLRTGECHF